MHKEPDVVDLAIRDTPFVLRNRCIAIGMFPCRVHSLDPPLLECSGC